MKLRERKKRKSGSALLVVLGFLSFMVISAVAFAIYMRTERVPSSALRRNTATRHLVKAAMAHAMSRVDDAIRNDSFPGLANTNGNNSANFYHDADNNSMDLWLGRVFMPPDPAGLLDDKGRQVSAANEPDKDYFAWRFAPVTETVSVLNLEALGYLPSPLVNDVRFLSRSSWAAKWQNFPFDAGRFAFCAVNVSDYFDINRTKVGVRSSPLDSSISLLETLTLSRKKNPVDDDPDSKKFGSSFYFKDLTEANREKLSELIGPYATRQADSSGDVNSTTEYISMLDYNLAFGEKSSGEILDICDSPFYAYLKEKRGSLYKNTTFNSQSDNRLNMAMCQPFVTDSFATNEIYSVADFSTKSGQPFPDVDMSGNLSFDEAMMKVSSPFLKELRNRNSDFGCFPDIFFPVFYDYLDHDDVPLSLAMPSVERVPMVTAVELAQNNFGKLRMVPGPTSTEPEDTTKFTGTQTKTTQFMLHPDSFCGPEPMVRVLLSFPFRHLSNADIKSKKFDVQVLLKVFSASVPRDKMVYRPISEDVGALADLRPKDDTEWNESKPFAIGGEGNVIGYSFCSQPKSVPSEMFDSPDDEEQALRVVEVDKWKSTTRDSPVMYTVKTKQEYENGLKKGALKPFYQLNLRPFGKDGKKLLQDVKEDEDQSGEVTDSVFADDEFRMHAVMWVRIINQDGDTCDLAPAILADDALNPNGKGNVSSPVVQNILGSRSAGYLLFRGQSSFKYKDFPNSQNLGATVSGLDGGSDPNWEWPALATVDPRYNYDPEDWFRWDRKTIDGSAWRKMLPNEEYFRASRGRDPDIFMFTSNQGYLQSLGEFAFLPNLQFLSSDTKRGEDYVSDPKEIRNRECAWRSITVDRSFYEELAKYKIGRSIPVSQTVNPYSDNWNVLMAAFANTPCDYWTTGRILAGWKSRTGENPDKELKEIIDYLGDTNEDSGKKIGDESACMKHAFCKENSDASSRMTQEQTFGIAKHITSAIRSAPNKSWEEVYDELFENEFLKLDPARDDRDNKDVPPEEDFMGQRLENCPLYSVDRKFLYSYWRDCFANKQQLFLIFVRAESTALGGPGEGTPSQQGGRAVALVWREPVAYDVDNHSDTLSDNQLNPNWRQDESVPRRRPHRMRVLFYHQFD